MRKRNPNFQIFWQELQLIRHGFFRPDGDFIGQARALYTLCDKYHTDDLFLALCKELRWNS